MFPVIEGMRSDSTDEFFLQQKQRYYGSILNGPRIRFPTVERPPKYRPFNLLRRTSMSTEKQGTSHGGSHEQHVKAGEQSHKNSESGSSGSSKEDSSKQSGSPRGGTSEQHAEAGRQSHKK
jgi:hypothetical protein